MRNDIKAATKLIRLLDKRWNLWETKIDEIVGETSGNPLLENVTDYLIEEMSAEEDELLGFSSSEGQEERRAEADDELTGVIDRLVLYLRLVHSLDFYNAAHYACEDEMPNRCGIFHVRDRPSGQLVTEAQVSEYIEAFNAKIGALEKTWLMLSDDKASKLGTKNEEEAVEIFVQANTEELGSDKFLCPLSGKKFKGAEFVRKHIFKKHAEKVEEVKKDVAFFNNYIKDPNRPNLPARPKPAAKESKPVLDLAAKGNTSKPFGGVTGGGARPLPTGPPRGSVKDRLGYKSAAARLGQADPRGMIDYSDLDFVDDDLF